MYRYISYVQKPSPFRSNLPAPPITSRTYISNAVCWLLAPTKTSLQIQLSALYPQWPFGYCHSLTRYCFLLAKSRDAMAVPFLRNHFARVVYAFLIHNETIGALTNQTRLCDLPFPGRCEGFSQGTVSGFSDLLLVIFSVCPVDHWPSSETRQDHLHQLTVSFTSGQETVLAARVVQLGRLFERFKLVFFGLHESKMRVPPGQIGAVHQATS